jgi:recombination protein RecT
MSTQLTTKTQELKALLTGDRMREQFAAALPKHLTPERFCRVALTALTRTPKLAECTQESFFRCLLDLSAFGLEPDGRRAHLIPYGNQCTLILDWKGIAELALRSGLIAKLHADIVCENDEFAYDLGEIKTHKIDFKQPRGAMYAVYALAVTKDGQTFVAVMHKEEVEAIRKRSRAGNSGPWQTDYNEMAKKTAFRRLAKWLPLSAEFRDALDKDDDLVLPEREAPKAARAEPLDPFNGLPEKAPEVVEAEFTEQPSDEPNESDILLTDTLATVGETTDAATLTSLVEDANRNFTGAKQTMLKRAINERAKALGFEWSKAKGGFEQP